MDPKPSETQPEPPQALTREDVAKMVSEQVSGALVRRMATFSKDLDAKLETHLGSLVEKLAATRSEAAPAATAPSPADGESARALAETQKRLKALEAQLAQRDEAIKAEKAARMQQEELQTLTQALTAKGVDGPRLPGAVALLYHAERRVARNDEGGIVFRRGDEHLPLEAGIAEWLGTDVGKVFIPAKGAGGAGTVPGGKPTTGTERRANGKLTDRELENLGRKAFGLPEI